MFRRLVLGWIAFEIAVLAGGYFVLFYTSVPTQAYAWALGRMGAVVTDATGSLNDGVTIGKIVWSDPKQPGFSATIEGLRFQYSKVDELFKHRRIAIDHYTIDRMNIRLPENFAQQRISESIVKKADPSAPSPGASASAAENAKPDEFQKLSAILVGGERPLIRELHVGEIRVSNTKIEYVKSNSFGAPTDESIELSEVLYRDMRLGPGFSLAELVVASPKFEVRAKGLAFQKDTAAIERVEGKLRTAWDPDHLPKDLEFAIKFQGSPKDLAGFQASLEAVGGKIRARFGPQMKTSLAVTDLTIRELYTQPLPITKLEFEILETPFMRLMMGAAEIRGGFEIGGHPFRFGSVGERAQDEGVALRAVGIADGRRFTVDINPRASSRSHPPTAPLTLRSNFSQSAQDNLAVLLHKAMYADLDDVRRMEIDTELKYFNRGADAAPKRVVRAKAVPKKQSPRVVQKPSAAKRAPASSKR